MQKELTLWEKFVIWFKSLFIIIDELEDETFNIDEIVKEKEPRKSPDTTPFTKYHYDVVMEEYNEMIEHNNNRPKGISRLNTTELTSILNTRLDLNKSRTTYSRIWTGKIKKEDLPDQLTFDV